MIRKYKEMDEEMRKFLSMRSIALGLLFIFTGSVWLAQILGYMKSVYVIPATFVVVGIFLIAEGLMISRL